MANQPSTAPLPERKTTWAWAVGTFFGAGLLKPGPGTYGSISAAILWYGCGQAWHVTALGTAIAALVATLIGIPAATIVARESGREDPGHVVIDEVAGQLVALIAIPCDWRHAAVALLLFRIFDIFKPWPIRLFERLPRGYGIMLDDIAAGLFALLFGHILLHWYA